MQAKSSFVTSGSLASSLKSIKATKVWHLRCKPVCASTEIDLSRWLEQEPLRNSTNRVVLAGRQNFGRGQYGRIWESSYGGIWLSAAIPMGINVSSSSLFGLAVAVTVANTLREHSVPVKLKWPNDLMVNKKKLAGFLPRIFSRGEMIRYARIGIGLNLRNRVPKEAISLAKIFDNRNLSISEWSSRIIISLEKLNFLMGDPKSLCSQAEEILIRDFFEVETGKTLKIEGINSDGSLILAMDGTHKSLYHWQ